MTTRANENLGSMSDLAALINAKYNINEPQQSTTFRDFLKKRIKGRTEYYLFGDVRYLLQPELDSRMDWRVREINRALTYYKDEEQHQREKRWSILASIIAVSSLLTALVSAFSDLPQAWQNVRALLGG